MTDKCIWIGAFLTAAVLFVSADAQQKVSQGPLVLTGTIPLRNVLGRIDHFGFDARGRVFVSALGNNTVEVIDTSAQRDVHTNTDVPTPQGVVYSPETNKLLVASAKGKLYIYDGSSFALQTTIDFHGDADNLRYNAATRQVYLGYGEDDGAMAVIDAATSKRLDDFKVGPHGDARPTLRSWGNGRVESRRSGAAGPPQLVGLGSHGNRSHHGRAKARYIPPTPGVAGSRRPPAAITTYR